MSNCFPFIREYLDKKGKATASQGRVTREDGSTLRVKLWKDFQMNGEDILNATSCGALSFFPNMKTVL